MPTQVRGEGLSTVLYKAPVMGPQLSEATGTKVGAVAAIGQATVLEPLLSATTGCSASTTVTWKLQVATLPAASVAV